MLSLSLPLFLYFSFPPFFLELLNIILYAFYYYYRQFLLFTITYISHNQVNKEFIYSNDVHVCRMIRSRHE